MDFNEYQKLAESVAIYPNKGSNVIYPCLGLIGESGEVAEKIKKIIRDKQNQPDESDKLAIKKELGDVLWYVAMIAREIGLDMNILVDYNLSDVYMSTGGKDIPKEIFKLIFSVSQIVMQAEVGYSNMQRRMNMAGHLGSVIQSIRDIGFNYGLGLHDIAQENINKLNSRKENNTLKGSGDDR